MFWPCRLRKWQTAKSSEDKCDHSAFKKIHITSLIFTRSSRTLLQNKEKTVIYILSAYPHHFNSPSTPQICWLAHNVLKQYRRRFGTGSQCRSAAGIQSLPCPYFFLRFLWKFLTLERNTLQFHCTPYMIWMTDFPYNVRPNCTGWQVWVNH